MKRILPFLFVAASLALIVPFHNAGAIEIGKPAPEIEATGIDGVPFKLSDHKGKIVVLEWTNAECPFVMKHYGSGNMQKLQKEATSMDGVEWITINSSAAGKQGNIDAAQAKAHLAAVGAAPTAYILDTDGAIGKAYDAKTTPHMFVVAADGTLAYAGAIDDNSSPRPEVIAESKNYVAAALGELKEGKPVTATTSQPYGCSVKY